MGQKTSPIGFRVGITLGWQSTWFAPKANYGEFLIEDWKIREYCDKRFNRQPPYAAVAKVEISRTRNEVKVTLHTGRPGMVIGPRGAEVDKLREELEDLIDRKINVNVIEIKEPALNATLVAELIAEQLKKRTAYRRAMKSQCEAAMNAGAKGVKIICGGRLGGAEIARNETQKLGSIPLQTLDANVDYGVATSRTTYGAIGIKVWIYKGKFGEEIVEVRPSRPQRGRRDGPDGRVSRPRSSISGGVRTASSAPKSAAPKSAAPKSAAPKSAAPKSAAPKSAAPKSATPKSTAPKSTAPAVEAVESAKPDDSKNTEKS